MRSLSLLAIGCMVLTVNATAQAGFEDVAEGPFQAPISFYERAWDASVRIFGGQDDNVQLAPETTFFQEDQESSYYGFSVDAVVYKGLPGGFTAGLAVAFDQVYYTEDDRPLGSWSDPADEYDLTVLHPAVRLERRLELGGRTAIVALGYDTRREWLEVHAGGLESHTGTLDAAVEVWPELWLSLRYTYGSDDFEVEFPDPELNDRDAVRQAVRLGARYGWPGRPCALTVAYTYLDNDAEGKNFQYQADIFSGRFDTNLYGPLWLRLQATYDRRDYSSNASFWVATPGRTEQDITEYAAQLLWNINRHWSADLYWFDSRYDSEIEAFEATRTDYGIGLAYHF